MTLAVSEQFTGGLLALQLNRAQAALRGSFVSPQAAETLAEALAASAALRLNQQSDLALVISGEEEKQINVALSTPAGTAGLGVVFGTRHHALAIRQEVCAMMALNVLRRWLNDQPLQSEHGWIKVVASAHL